MCGRRACGAAAAWVVLLIPTAAVAQLAPPSVQGSRPLGAAPGETVMLELRGANLVGITALLFDQPGVKVEGLQVDKGGAKASARVTLPTDLVPNLLGFRAVSPRGVSNPGRVWVGRPVPGRAETEPNNGFRKPQELPAPTVAVDGSISPGDDVDVYAVEARQGETLVAEVVAARAGSDLDALVTIFDPDGRELAWDDDQFGRDAAASVLIPRDGRYLVQVQDANGRVPNNPADGQMVRDYRLYVGRLPLVTGVFPPGGRRGGSTVFRLLGTNLPKEAGLRRSLPSSLPAGDWALSVPTPSGPANAVTIRVGDAPEFIESEPDDEPGQALDLVVPAAINGTLAEQRAEGGDLDVYRLRVEPGQEGEYVITAYAARVGSPADPVLMVLDEKGDLQAEDDDKLGRDARLERRIDGKGLLIAVRERFGRGGPGYVYRIEVERQGGQVAITADLGARTVPGRGSLAVPIAVDRRGRAEALTISAEGLPLGVTAEPVRLAPGTKGGVLVLTADDRALVAPFRFRLSADVPVAVTYRESGPAARIPAPGGAPAPGAAEAGLEVLDPVLAVSEPAPLGVAIEPAGVVVPAGGQAEVKVTLERREGPGRKPLKVKLIAGEGSLDGFEPIKEADVAADAVATTFILKAKPDAAPRRVKLTARAWTEGGPPSLGVDAVPIELTVPERPATK